MKKIIIIFFVSYIFCDVYAQTKIWTLEDCINYAYENNITLKKKELETKILRTTLKQSKMERFPDLNATSNLNNSFGRSLSGDNTYINTNSKRLSYSVSSSVNLFNGFRIKNTIKKNELNLLAQLEDYEKAKEDLTLNIASYYLQILFNIEKLKIALEQVDQTKEQIERTEQLIESGSLPRGDLLELQSQIANEELIVVESENQLALSYLDLAQLLDIKDINNFEIEEPDLNVDKDYQSLVNLNNIYERSLKIRPEIKALEYYIESSKIDFEINKGNRLPSLSLGGGLSSYYLDVLTDNVTEQFKNNESKYWALSLSIPIFNKWRVNQKIAQSKYYIRDAELNLDNQKNKLRKVIEEAYTNAIAALKKYHSSETAVEASEEAFRYAEEKHKLGLINYFDYLQSKNKLSTARLNFSQSKYEYIFRSKILDFYNGIAITL